jgi:hypothetical protein
LLKSRSPKYMVPALDKKSEPTMAPADAREWVKK